MNQAHDAPASPAPNLPADPAAFWQASGSPEERPRPRPRDSLPALERLGPLPKGRFPLMGYLETVYEQVARCAREALSDHAEDA